MKKMKKRRFTAFLLTFILLTASLAACHTKKKQEEMEEKTLSDDLYSYQVSIDGHVYSLPCPVSEFEEYGWVIDDDRELKPGDPLKVFLLESNTALRPYFPSTARHISVCLSQLNSQRTQAPF